MRRPTRDGRNTFRVDSHFCAAQAKYTRQLFALLPDSQLLSLDDKVKVHCCSNVRRPGASWTLGPAHDDPVHDFAATKHLSFSISAILDLQSGATMQLHSFASKSISQANLLVRYLRGSWSSPRRRPTSLLLMVDGGSDRTMKSIGNRLLYAATMLVLDIQVLGIIKWEPHGGSKMNPVERTHVATNRAIANIQLMSDRELHLATMNQLPNADKQRIVREAMEICQRRISEEPHAGRLVEAQVVADPAEFFDADFCSNWEKLKQSSARRTCAYCWPLSPALCQLRQQLGLPPMEFLPFQQLLDMLGEAHLSIGAHCAFLARCTSVGCFGGCLTDPKLCAMLGEHPANELFRLTVPMPVSPAYRHYVGIEDKLTSGIEPQDETCPSVLVKRAAVAADGILSDAAIRELSFLCCWPPGVQDHAKFVEYCRSVCRV
jgi:hypothetical protein